MVLWRQVRHVSLDSGPKHLIGAPITISLAIRHSAGECLLMCNSKERMVTKMKTFFLSIATILTSTAAFAGSSAPYISSSPSASGSDAEGAIVLLLVIGAVLLLGGGAGAGSVRAKTPEADNSDDDDIIMKF